MRATIARNLKLMRLNGQMLSEEQVAAIHKQMRRELKLHEQQIREALHQYADRADEIINTFKLLLPGATRIF